LSTVKELNIKIIKTQSRIISQNEDSENPVFEVIEIICIAWFTIEFILRFWSSPKRMKFLKNPFNIIDLISILPYFISLIFSNEEFKILFYETNNVRVFRLFRIFRILRIFKLARHSDGLQSFGHTLQKSYNELGLLIMFLSITVLIFSSLAYFAEKDEPTTDFTSIPKSFW
jgi:potassium voltage-gated channel Shab-related subfamily B protein 1